MEEVQSVEKRTIGCQKASLRICVYALFAMIGRESFLARFTPYYHDDSSVLGRLSIFHFVITLTIVSAIVALALSYQKKEQHTKKRTIALLGIPFLIVIEVVYQMFR